ncbi:mitochondrial 37S ribosomal protein rsm10 [Gnomoniopsis sp. IMI 355080]|nr:mitochondrial 37S ribosomal protein rsm10 [Gnomoniopsis sp. IMI 355080]
MSAPPVLRPLRAILQRRLQTVPSRQTQIPYYLRASHHRSQFRHNSSIPPDQPPKPKESSREASSQQTPEHQSTSTTRPIEETQNVIADSLTGNADGSVVTKFEIPGQDAIVEAAIPRLDNLLVKSAFQQLKTTDAEIQAGIAEALERQLAADEAIPQETQNVTSDVLTGITDGSVVTKFEIPGQDAIVEAAVPRLDNLLVKSAFQQLKITDAEIQAGIAEALARQLAADEATTVAVSDAREGNEADIRGASGPVVSESTVEDSAEAKANQPEFVVSQETEFASLPEEANNSTQQAPAVQQKVPESVVPETTNSAPASAEAVATMTKPAEPVELMPEPPAIESTPTEDAISKPVEPKPDALPLEEETIVAMTQELERLDNKPGGSDMEPELASVPESHEPSAVPHASEQTDTLKSAVAAGPSVDTQEEASSVDHSLDAVRDEELEKLDQDDLDMKALDDAAKRDLEAVGLYEGPEPSRIPRNVAAYYLQPLRRVAEYGVPACDLQLRSYSVRPLESFCDFALRAAYYLGLPAYGPVPLPRMIERWTVPRSHFIFKKSQENYERITRRRLIQIKDANPETVQVWLAFLQKHQQAGVGMKANLWEFSSIGKILLPIECCAVIISDANSAKIDVAKQLDEAYEEAEPLMREKYRLLQQNKEFETVEKVDEFLQATRYKVTGDQVERKQ